MEKKGCLANPGNYFKISKQMVMLNKLQQLFNGELPNPGS